MNRLFSVLTDEGVRRQVISDGMVMRMVPRLAKKRRV